MGIRVKINSVFRPFLLILLAGMGNFKQGDWKSTLVYFGFLFLAGSGAYYLAREFIGPYYQISMTARTFVILIFILGALFWDGTRWIRDEEEDNFFLHQDRLNGEDVSEESWRGAGH